MKQVNKKINSNKFIKRAVEKARSHVQKRTEATNPAKVLAMQTPMPPVRIIGF
jgi:hypothetical protein